MNHVYLSPHLDDAVLSCGGAIHRYTAAGEPVLVITVFAGEAAEQSTLSSFALEQHGYWGNPPRPVFLRRAEDAAALALLGAQELHLDYLDAVYRADADGRWIYADLAALMGEVHPDDPVALDGAKALADQLVKILPSEGPGVVYAPLGVGHHVDHQITHAAARRLLERDYRLAFYEDFPYAERPGALAAALAEAGAEGWRASTNALGATDVAAQVSALSYYRSQISVLFGGAEAMPNRVWAYAAACASGAGLAEKIWWPE